MRRATDRYQYRCDNCKGEAETAIAVQQDGGTVTWCLSCLWDATLAVRRDGAKVPETARTEAEERTDAT